jgi:5-methylcytosine-specific restriction endonuclease McrA
MGRNATAGGPVVNGRSVRAFFLAVIARYGTACHLCGGPGADTTDHLVPTSKDPSLRWDIDNARPAHHSCNSGRGDSALPGTFNATGW